MGFLTQGVKLVIRSEIFDPRFNVVDSLCEVYEARCYVFDSFCEIFDSTYDVFDSCEFFYPMYDVCDLRHGVLHSSSGQTFNLLSFVPPGCRKLKKAVNSFYGTSHFLDNPAATIDVLTGSGNP